MVSLASQNLRDLPGHNVVNDSQRQTVGDSVPASSGLAIKASVELNRSQRVDDAIELEQDAARLARNTIGISQKIATENIGFSHANQTSAIRSEKAAVQRAIPKDPVSDRRLNHFHHRDSPANIKQAKKRTLLGEPPRQVTLHRPTGAHSTPAAVVVS